MDIVDKVVVVTGAGSGIGRALASNLPLKALASLFVRIWTALPPRKLPVPLAQTVTRWRWMLHRVMQSMS